MSLLRGVAREELINFGGRSSEWFSKRNTKHPTVNHDYKIDIADSQSDIKLDIRSRNTRWMMYELSEYFLVLD